MEPWLQPPFLFSGWGVLGAFLVVDTVEMDTSTDPELPKLLQGFLVQAGGPQPLPIECQLQPSLLAQKQYLEESLGVKEERG